MKRTGNKGFSLVELIVVIAIMAILAAVAIPTFAGFIRKANEASDISFMNDLERALELSCADDVYGTPGSIKVIVNKEDGSIYGIECDIVREPYAAEVLRPIIKGKPVEEPKEQERMIIDMIDMDYRFKAAGSVSDNQNWKTTWTLVQETVVDPDA